MKVYVNSDCTAFESVENETNVYQGALNTSSIFLYFKKYFANNTYPILSMTLPNGRKVGSLLPIQLPTSSEYQEYGYKQCFQYKFTESDLLISGVANVSLILVTTDGEDDPTILKKLVVGSFSAKIMETANAGNYDITFSDDTSSEDAVKSMVSEFDNMRSVLANYQNQVTIDRITDDDLDELLL